jgi:GntR family transcriptional regulator
MARSPSKTQQVADDLRARIKSGALAPGEKLPSTKNLAAEYGVSEESIRLAVKDLKATGDVEGKWGKGVFVRSWEPLVYRPQSEFKDKTPELDVFKALLNAEGRDGEQTIEVLTVPAEEPVRRRLQMEEGELVAVRRRTSIVNGEPFFTDDSYVPLKLVEGSEWMSAGTVERGTNQVLAELGHELVTALDEVYIRMPQAADLPRLALDASNPIPVFELISTGHDQDSRPVQVTLMLMPAHKNVLVYERKKYPTRNGDV